MSLCRRLLTTAALTGVLTAPAIAQPGGGPGMMMGPGMMRGQGMWGSGFGGIWGWQRWRDR